MCAVFAAVIYIAALIALAPASLFDLGLDRATAGRLRLTDARGTIWSGHAALELRSEDAKRAYAKTVSWHAHARSLFRGELRYTIELQGAPRPYLLSASPVRLQLENAELRVPSTVLGIVSSQMAPLLLTGEITLRAPRIAIEHDRVDGAAVLRWSEAGSTLVPFVAFGEYELHAKTAGVGARATLRTLDGPLTLTGEGSWAPREHVRMRINARVAQSHYQKLAPLLRLIAFERKEGFFELALR